MEGSHVESNGKSVSPQSNGGNLLTVAQVAQLLNAHPHSVRRWADSGLLHCYRIGFRCDRRFRAQDVSAFLGSYNGNGQADHVNGHHI